MGVPRHHVFGPVFSGRLGRSLGLDPIGGRICSYDCLYCEAGTTLSRTTKRHAYVPAEVIIAELAAWKAEGHEAPDVITFSGMGEPTLSTECAAIIAGAKALFPAVPVAVLTNASMLADPAVRADIRGADMVLPSMDSLVEEEFRRINRPHGSLRLADIRQGLLDFRADYSGLLFLEILLVAGINDSDANLEALTAFYRELAPDRVDVVTISRPAAYAGTLPASPETLAHFRAALGGFVARTAAPSTSTAEGDDLAERIEASTERRPQTIAGLAAALGVAPATVESAVSTLETEGRLRRHVMGTEVFFLPPRR